MSAMIQTERPTKIEVGASVAIGVEPDELLRFFAQFENLRRIGVGGIANVYSANPIGSRNRLVALKVIQQELVSDFRALDWVRNERNALALLQDVPHVLALAQEQSSCRLALVTELIRGSTINKVSPTLLDYPIVSDFGAQIAVALSGAHERSIVHRDIKPENVLVDHRGQVTVIDWGFATAMEQSAAEWETIVGTPLYMSPEQCEGNRLDARTDIYSLGCTLYEVLTGKEAFKFADGATPLGVMHHHTKFDGPNPRKVRRWLPRGLGELVARCMRRDPKQRFQTARELQQALRWYTQSWNTRCWLSLRSLFSGK